MALGYLALDLMRMEDRVQRLERRTQRQLLRATEDPFDLTNNEFRELYRLTPDLIFDLIDALEPRLQRTRITGLSTEKKVIQSNTNYNTIYFTIQCIFLLSWEYLFLYFNFNLSLLMVHIYFICYKYYRQWDFMQLAAFNVLLVSNGAFAWARHLSGPRFCNSLTTIIDIVNCCYRWSSQKVILYFTVIDNFR